VAHSFSLREIGETAWIPFFTDVIFPSRRERPCIKVPIELTDAAAQHGPILFPPQGRRRTVVGWMADVLKIVTRLEQEDGRDRFLIVAVQPSACRSASRYRHH